MDATLSSVFVEAGMAPATEAPLDWIAGRYEAVGASAPNGCVVARFTDPETTVELAVITMSGEILSSALFGLDPIGRRMFAAAITAADLAMEDDV